MYPHYYSIYGLPESQSIPVNSINLLVGLKLRQEILMPERVSNKLLNPSVCTILSFML